MLSPRRAWIARALPLALATIGLSGAASAAQAAPTWLAPTTLSAAGQPVEVPQVASSAVGDAVAVWQRSDGTKQIVQASSRSAGGAWQGPVSLSAAGQDAFDPQVATDASGTAVAVWCRSNGTNRVVQAAVRPAGGDWPGTPDTISVAGGDAEGPHVALDGQGNAVAIWRRYNGNNTSIVQAAFRPAGGPWQTSVSLSAVGQDAYDPRVAIDRQGNALAVWDRSDGARQVVQASFRPAGGGWQTPVAVSGTGLDASYPELAIDGQGNAVIVFSRAGTNYRVQAATRTADGAWTPPVFLSPVGADTLDYRVAVDAAGDTVAVWQQDNGTNFVAEAAVRPAGGTWQPPVAISDPSSSADFVEVGLDAQGDATASWVWGSGPGVVAQSAVRPRGGTWGAPATLAGSVGAADLRLAVDEQGNATGLWRQYDGANTRVKAAGYDAAGPRVRALTGPGTAAVGELVGFSVSPLDVWSGLGATTWSFGDGATADGIAVTHAFAASGAYPVTATSSDALGNVTTRTTTVQVSGAPAREPVPDPGPSPTPDPPRNVAPVLSGVGQSHATWRVGAKVAPATAKAPPVGTVFSFRLDQVARVTATFTQRRAGRKAGRMCVAPTKRNRRSRACTRTVKVGVLAVTGRVGKNTLPFVGRLSRTKTLTPGRYTVTLGAVNAAGQRAVPKSLAFTVRRAAR